MEKPPLGIKPKWVHDLQRINEILEGMKRYNSANMLIPEKWLFELETLFNQFLVE